jgi:hypothetical protein
MPLDRQQAVELEAAVARYGFPPVYFDFGAGVEVRAENMRTVEAEIREMLTSAEIPHVRDGLSNVIYWGYAQMRYRDVRVKRFRDTCVDDQLRSFRALIGAGETVGLIALKQLNLPEFSGISFLSKILAFLDPVHHCVLDKQLLKLATVSGNRALHRVSARTQIPVTASNERAYRAWCEECANVSDHYYVGRYRVVDVERGFFQLLQEKKVGIAQDLYAAA